MVGCLDVYYGRVGGTRRRVHNKTEYEVPVRVPRTRSADLLMAGGPVLVLTRRRPAAVTMPESGQTLLEGVPGVPGEGTHT